MTRRPLADAIPALEQVNNIPAKYFLVILSFFLLTEISLLLPKVIALNRREATAQHCLQYKRGNKDPTLGSKHQLFQPL